MSEARLEQSWFGDLIIQSPDGVTAAPTKEAEVVEILRNRQQFPDPVRPVGSRHSMTECISARARASQRWGTLVDLSGYKSLCDEQGRPTGETLRLGRDEKGFTVTVPAGRRFIDVARELSREDPTRPRLQFSVNTELGSLTMGAAACGATKDSSFPGESGQVCHDVVGMRLIRPNGERQELSDEEDLKALRCSYGLFGVVTEVTFRVHLLEFISLNHSERIKPANEEGFTRDDFETRLTDWVADRNAVFLYMFPYSDRIVAELRKKPATGGGEKEEESARLKVRNFFWEKGLPMLQSTTTSLRGQKMKETIQDAFDRAVEAFLKGLVQLRQVNPVAQLVDFDAEPQANRRFTFSMWAFPAARFPEILPQYFKLCEDHEDTYRSCLPHVSYHIARDQSSLLSYSHDGDVWTLDPICPHDEKMLPGWKAFLAKFNDFSRERGGVPLLNQTPLLERRHVKDAFKSGNEDRLAMFEAKRRPFDPDGRMLNDYFAKLLAS
jgi:FAD/FMN-containing dehydrogenase